MSFIKLLSSLEFKFIQTDYWALLFIGCLSLYIPFLWASLPVYVIFKTKRKAELPIPIQAPSCPVSEIVLFIQRNHLRSLSSAIDSNPDILYCEYKNQDLLTWCKYYNNSKAQSVIIQMTKKYPKTQLLSA